MSEQLVGLPSAPFAPSLFGVLEVSFSSVMSIAAARYISMAFAARFESEQYVGVVSMLCTSVEYYYLGGTSGSFGSATVLSFPGHLSASSVGSVSGTLRGFDVTHFTPTWEVFFASSTQQVFPPAAVKVLVTQLVYLEELVISSYSSSRSSESGVVDSSTPLSL